MMDTIGKCGPRGRRRAYSAEEKARVVAACHEPGASVSQVARLYDINANLVFNWCRQLRQPLIPPTGCPALVAVELVDEGKAWDASSSSISVEDPVGSDVIEVVLVDGVRLRLGAGFDAAALKRALSVLRMST